MWNKPNIFIDILYLDRYINLYTLRPNGTTFAVAKADCELPSRAVRGDVVTFTHDFLRRSGTHDILGQDNMQMQWTQQGAQTRTMMQQEAARGLPANIVVHRIRTDVIWEDVVSTAGHPVRQFHNGLLPTSLQFWLNLFALLLMQCV